MNESKDYNNHTFWQEDNEWFDKLLRVCLTEHEERRHRGYTEEEWERLVTVNRELLFSCIQCGKCMGGCPISLICRTFNIRRILYEILNTEGEEVAHNKDYLWNCSACGTCMTRCPKGVDPMKMVFTLRSVLVEDGEVPPKIREVLKSIDIRKNPWGMGKDLRTEWAEGLSN